jgi:hypothetical protein
MHGCSTGNMIARPHVVPCSNAETRKQPDWLAWRMGPGWVAWGPGSWLGVAPPGWGWGGPRYVVAPGFMEAAVSFDDSCRVHGVHATVLVNRCW